MAVKENRGDFFSKGRTLKESFYPKFFIKKLLQWPLKKGCKLFVFKKILDFNLDLVYTLKSCRRFDLLFVRFIYASLFKFRSTNLIFLKQRLNKTVKKRIYERMPYNHLEKSSIKLFSDFFNKEVIKKGFVFFFITQKLLTRQIIKNYRKKSYFSLMVESFIKKFS